MTGRNAEAELGRRMSLFAKLENEKSRIKWGASPTLDRLLYNKKKRRYRQLSRKASRINRMLLNKLNVTEIADYTNTTTEDVGHIVSKYNLPRTEEET